MLSASVEDMESPPAKLKLVLSESAKKYPPSLGGQYLLGKGLVNEKNHWIHRSGHSAIWWTDEGWFWCVGVYEKLGEDFAGIVGPYFEKKWPTLITKGWKYSDGNEWIDANPEDIKFHDWSAKKEPNPPLKLNLQLSGETKNVQWKRAGPYDINAKTSNAIYNLGPKDVNGYSHWIHEKGKQGIWFNKISKSWFIGDIEDLGNNVAGISGPKGEDDLPSSIVRGWKYAKEENSDKPKFVEASQGEIVLRDLN